MVKFLSYFVNIAKMFFFSLFSDFEGMNFKTMYLIKSMRQERKL